ncbi:pilus assembly protein FimV, partial [Colwellia chukchiensis]
MQKILRLCLWQVLFISISCFSLPISAEESGIRIRGPKASDAFPYDRYGPITGKDTLWNIALKVRPDPRFSVYQVMQALFETNPDAFKENNFNHMVSGQYLKIPTIDVIRAINPEIAQQKSRQDDQMWQKKVVKVAAKKPQTPAQISVNKQDLEAAKSEINVQLQAIDSTQQQRLATIQNDVLDSIDGLQSLLKENEALRQRLGRFNDQLDVMQQEVAKGKEIKLQMDNMLALQQELLAKAEAREQALLLAKQKAELEQNSLMSSAWFVALMATLPAVLVLSIIAWLWRKRASKTHDNDNKDSKAPAAPAAETENKATAVADNDEDKLALDDDLDLGDELTLDDELAIDLSEIDDADEDLFSDSLDSADDDVIALDDDLDDLDDLEDISLDTIALDESLEEDDVLEGGQLNQDDLDSLFAGLEDEPSEDEQDEAIIASPEQSALADEADESTVVPENAVEDIDALLDAASEEVDSAASFAANQDEGNNNADQPEISDPDDIDALLDVASEEVENAESLADNQKDDNNADQQEISDPDDIDALLDAIGTTSADDSKQDNDA